MDVASLHKPVVKNSEKVASKVRKVDSNVNDSVIYGAASATKDVMDKNDLKPKKVEWLNTAGKVNMAHCIHVLH